MKIEFIIHMTKIIISYIISIFIALIALGSILQNNYVTAALGIALTIYILPILNKFLPKYYRKTTLTLLVLLLLGSLGNVEETQTVLNSTAEENNHINTKLCDNNCKNKLGTNRVNAINSWNCDTLPYAFATDRSENVLEWKYILHDKAVELACEGFISGNFDSIPSWKWKQFVLTKDSTISSKSEELIGIAELKKDNIVSLINKDVSEKMCKINRDSVLGWLECSALKPY